MDFSRDLIVALLSSVGTTVIIATLTLAWRWLTSTTPARNFWQLGPNSKVCIAMSMTTREPSEQTVYVPAGDLVAFSEIVAFLKHIHPKVEITLHRETEQPIMDWDQTIVLIGGGKYNSTSLCLLGALNPPAHAFDHEFAPHYDSKALLHRESRLVLLESYFENGILSSDWAFTIRAPNPFYPDKNVFILVGGFSHGTHGAAVWTTQPKNLAWLWRERTRQRLAEIIGRHLRTNSIEVVLRVPAVARLSISEVPSVGVAEVYHHEGGDRPYYFRAPDRYQDLYNHMVSNLREGDE